ncbi:MAG: methyltransferase domain-containing protein [Saprospiraceae bacterium]|nr:methyltransferase domain-containing protein [Saprospiraceae bacterium]
MREAFLQKLRSPDDHTGLHLEAGELVSEKGDWSYELKEGIPVLLAKEMVAAMSSEVHDQFGTDFQYVEHYQEDARQFDYFKEAPCKASEEEARRLHQTILSEMPINNDWVLDVGCGAAWVAGALCPKGKKVISFDISYDNPAKAQKKYPFENHFSLVGDAFNIPMHDNAVDAIVASEIIEHVPNPAAFLKELFRVLKPGGKLIVTTPYNEKIIYSLCIHCNRPTPMHAHLHSFTEKGILNLTRGLQHAKGNSSGFSNKMPILLRLNTLLSFLPYGAWKVLDQFLNTIIKKPSRLLLTIEKQAH